MKFKKAAIDFRWSVESGHDANGRYHRGETKIPRRIDNLYPGQRIVIEDGRNFTYLEIDQAERPVDALLFLDQRMAYAFTIDGTVKDEYTVVRFFFDGFYYIFEYRFISRENEIKEDN